MRPKRLKIEGPATYHVMSRAHESRYFFSDVEKSYMSDLMRRLSSFTGCEIRTYVFMDNHFHILLHVPAKQDITDEEVKRRAKILYGKRKYQVFEATWKIWQQSGQSDRIKDQLDKFRVRMYDLSEFMKTFKQRLSIYYNSNTGRTGAGCLWQERFKSVLIEESEHAQLVVAAYIDLNPLRAGLVKDPKDYHWSGYAEAVARGGSAAERISKLFVNHKMDQHQSLAQYRKNLYLQGDIRYNHLTSETIRPGFKPESIESVLNEEGKLSLPDLLNCRVRYFSDGVVIGSRVFVNHVFNEYKGNFSLLRRNRGAKQMKNGDWGDLCAARELRLRIISAANKS